MGIDYKILKEISRYKQINNYLTEQDVPPPPAEEPALPPAPDAGGPPTDITTLPAPTDAAAGATPPPAPATPPQPVDTATDPDVEKIGDEKEGKKELEITDLVKSQKNVEKKQEEYFDNLFKHLTDLENKLSDMDSIMTKLNDLEAKVEKYRPKSSQEKLELRSLDSGPFNQKLSDFFEDKREDFEKTGKEEYILTKDEVEDYSPSDIKKSFRDFEQGRDDIEDNFQKLR